MAVKKFPIELDKNPETSESFKCKKWKNLLNQIAKHSR